MTGDSSGSGDLGLEPERGGDRLSTASSAGGCGVRGTRTVGMTRCSKRLIARRQPSAMPPQKQRRIRLLASALTMLLLWKRHTIISPKCWDLTD